MRLIVEGFSLGLIDSNIITRMGLARPQEGLSREEITLPKCPAIDINAVEFFPKNAIGKMRGRESLQSAPWVNSAIIRLYQWRSESLVDYSLVFSCVSGVGASASIARISKLSGPMTFEPVVASAASLSAWSPTVSGDMIDICSFGGSAIMTYGGANMPLAVYIGGLSIEPLGGTGAPSGVKAIAGWGSYLFAGNILDGSVRYASRVRWCQPLVPTNWPTWSYIDLDPMDGDEIKAMWLLGNILVVFKKYKTFIIKYVGGVLEFDWERIDASIGCVGCNALTECDGVIYFISADGFYAYDGTRPPYEVDANIKGLTYDVYPDLDTTFEVDYYDNDQMFFTVANGTAIRKNRVYVYDTELKNWSKWDAEIAGIGSINYGAAERYVDFPLTYEEYSLRIGDAKGLKDTIFTFGSYDGFLHKYGNTLNDLGSAIEASWTSPWIDFGYPDRNKRILRVYIYVEGTDDVHTISFDGFVDWNSYVPVVTKTFTTQATDRQIAEKRLDFTQACRAFQFRLTSEELNSQVVIHKVIIDFLIKGRTITS